MTVETVLVTLGALNAAGVLGLFGAVMRWVLAVERRLARIEARCGLAPAVN